MKRDNPPASSSQDLRRHLTAIQRAALRAADAGAAVRRHLRLEHRALVAGRYRVALHRGGRIWLVALGKAAPAMAAAASRALGRRLTQGVVTALGATPSIHPSLVTVAAGHPLPDHGSLMAGERARRLLTQSGAGDILLALVSGGGSAMFELLAEGVALDELRTLNDLLIRSGATVREINTVRKALSRVKGGGLARLASPARTIGLILSDVVGDSLSSIASGPTILRAPRPDDARRVLEMHRLWDKASPGIRSALERAGRQPISPTPRPINLLVGSNRAMIQAALHEATSRRLRPRLLSGRMEGEAREVGAGFARRLLRASSGTCLVMGGETTVTVRGEGKGGRNQELALAAALELQGASGAAIMSLASDGIDGPTDAAGAWVDGRTISRAREAGFDPGSSLRANDSYPLLRAAGALLSTGPTGTNVGDLVVGLRL